MQPVIEMQEWASTLSRRVWSKQVRLVKPEPMEQFCVGENEDDCSDPVQFFIGLRGGIYSLKGYSKIKSS